MNIHYLPEKNKYKLYPMKDVFININLSQFSVITILKPLLNKLEIFIKFLPVKNFNITSFISYLSNNKYLSI